MPWNMEFQSSIPKHYLYDFEKNMTPNQKKASNIAELRSLSLSIYIDQDQSSKSIQKTNYVAPWSTRTRGLSHHGFHH